MFSNEHPGETYEGDITVATRGSAYIYDAMENIIRPISYVPCDIGTKIHLKLEPYQSTVVIFGEAPGIMKAAPIPDGKRYPLAGEWKLSFAEAKEYPVFLGEERMLKLENIGKTHPDFSGVIKYENTMKLSPEDEAVLEIENAFDGVEVWVNEKYAGMKICPPYRFDISDLVTKGENSLRIEVATTLERAVSAMENDEIVTIDNSDIFHAPTGIIGDISVYIR
jgi:hypothetical protein